VRTPRRATARSGPWIAVEPAFDAVTLGQGALRVVPDVEALPFASGALDLVVVRLCPANRERSAGVLIQIRAR